MNNNKLISEILNRPNILNNKVVIVDGLIGGGKSMLSAILGSLPRVEMWIHRGKVEQICGMRHLQNISMEGAISLLKSWTDEEFYKLSIVRDINLRPTDMSSIFKDARPWRYFIRLFQDEGIKAVQRIKDSDYVLNVMTHAISGYAEPIFNAFDDRLVYIRLVRSPMTQYMLNHLSRWSSRWGNDIDGMILHHHVNSDEHKNVPFFIKENEENYLRVSSIDRAILMLEEWQNRGDKVIDKLKNTSSAKIIEVPFEKFVMDPDPFMASIADAIGTNIDWITKRMMKKQGVPRSSLSDAPFNKVYSKLGWKAPRVEQNIFQEFEHAREVTKMTASSHAMDILDKISEQYIKRYKLE